MTGHLAALAAMAGLWLVLAALSSLSIPLLWRLVAGPLGGRDAERRAHLAWLAAVGPTLMPSALVLLCALPGILGALTGAGDHCTAHAEHPHFCPIHATLSLTPMLGVALVAVGLRIVPLAREAFALLGARTREARWLRRRYAAGLAPDVHLLQTPEPIALTHGLHRPEIWISQTLHDALGDEERAVVIAHERAHAQRLDPARLLTASIASRLHRPAFRTEILDALRLATEQACDARAAARVGDPLRVAETLLRVERLMQGSPGRLRFATSLVDTSLAPRIEALLSADATRPDRGEGSRKGWILIATAVLLASPLHHLAEHVLEGVLRSMVGLHALF